MLHVAGPPEEWWPIPDPDLGPEATAPPLLRHYLRSLYNRAGWTLFTNVGPQLRSLAKSNPPFAWLYRRDPRRYRRRLALDEGHSRHGFAQYRHNLHAMVAWCRARGIAIA